MPLLGSAGSTAPSSRKAEIGFLRTRWTRRIPPYGSRSATSTSEPSRLHPGLDNLGAASEVRLALGQHRAPKAIGLDQDRGERRAGDARRTEHPSRRAALMARPRSRRQPHLAPCPTFARRRETSDDHYLWIDAPAVCLHMRSIRTMRPPMCHWHAPPLGKIRRHCPIEPRNRRAFSVRHLKDHAWT